jgi:hypothetical protein
MPKKDSAPKPAPRGPEPDLLKIDGDWRDAVKTSLEKKKPASGWPKDK